MMDREDRTDGLKMRREQNKLKERERERRTRGEKRCDYI